MRDRIIKIMQERGINSMAQLERQAGVPSGTMRNMGQGHIPSMDKVRKIANVLGVSVDYIVNGTEIQQEPKKESDQSKVQSSDPIREFCSLIGSLSDQNMEVLLDYLRYLISKQERD